MSLNASNFVSLGPIKSVDMKQFVDLFTGVMTDQPVTFKNAMLVGGNQGSSTAPLKLFGVSSQTGNLIELYPTTGSSNPTFGFGALGNFAWGPGSPAANDTFLSRVATQNGHVTDTAGLLISPYLEVAGNISATTYVYANGATITGPGANPFQLVVNQDLVVNRNLTVSGATNKAGNITFTTDGAGILWIDGNHRTFFASGTGYTDMGVNGFVWRDTSRATATAMAVTGAGTLSLHGLLALFDGVPTGGSDVVRGYVRAVPGGNGIQFLNAAGSAVTLGVDNAGNLGVTGALTSATYIAAGPGLASGAVGDINAARSATTGYLFLGSNGAHYMGFDGTNFGFVGANLNVPSLTSAGGITAQAAITTATGLAGATLSASSYVLTPTLYIGTDTSKLITQDGSNMFYRCKPGFGHYFQDNAGAYVPVATGSLTVTGSISATVNVNAGGNVTVTGRLAAGGILGSNNGDVSANRGDGTGHMFLGGGNRELNYNGSQYNFANGGCQADWFGGGTPRQDTYVFTAPNNSSHAGKGIAFGWDVYSSAAGKTDIAPIDDALAIVADPTLHGMRYTHTDGGPSIGFIAEDWAKVMPEVVSIGGDGNPVGMDYSRITALLFEALKQLAEKVG